jgi:hypothetical protein
VCAPYHRKFRTGGKWKSSTKLLFYFRWAGLHNKAPKNAACYRYGVQIPVFDEGGDSGEK